MATSEGQGSTGTDRTEHSGEILPELLALPNNSNADSIIKAAQNFHETELLDLTLGDGNEIEVLVLPVGKRAISTKPFHDRYRQFPERKEGTAQFTDLESFIAHVKRTGSEHTVIFGNDSLITPQLIAVYDYNEEKAGNAGWLKHRAVYTFPFSDEWIAWREKQGEENAMRMRQFAEFLEDRVIDVVDPAKSVAAGSYAEKVRDTLGVDFASPTRLVQISRQVSVNAERNFAETVDLQGGAKQVSFIEKNKDAAGQPFKIEGGFLISIPVFRNEKPWVIPVLLRFRTANGVFFFYDVYRMDLHFYQSFKRAAAEVREATGLPVLMGLPEAPR